MGSERMGGIRVTIDGKPCTQLKEDYSYDLEINKAIKQMTIGKAPGPDAIPAEVNKTSGETLRNQLPSLFQSMWKQEHLPQ
ncbi:hypothetical protein ACOMHN_036472 [Nucella lapillus]